MLNTAARRAQFATTADSTASPQVLLVKLYDRLALDLERAQASQTSRDWAVANRQLQHAQEIIIALAGALDVDAWNGGPGLRSLYAWLLSEMVRANTSADASRTATCRSIVETLRDAWRDAADQLSTAANQPVLAAVAGLA